MIRVIACDLDGTLFTDDAMVSRRSGRLLHTLWQQGLVIVLATGRSWRTALKAQLDLGITGPIIAHNGAYVFDTASEQEWHRRPVAMADARSILAFADQQEIMMRCYLGYRQPVLFNRFTRSHRRHWLRPEDQWVDQLAKHLPIEPIEIFFYGSEEVTWFLHRFGRIGAGYELSVFPHGHIQEANICAPGVDKVEGLAAVTGQLGLRREDVLAIGDGPNDVLMLDWAGLSVAVATGVSEAKARADYVTSNPNLEPVEDGILWALEHDRQGRHGA